MKKKMFYLCKNMRKGDLIREQNPHYIQLIYKGFLIYETTVLCITFFCNKGHELSFTTTVSTIIHQRF